RGIGWIATSGLLWRELFRKSFLEIEDVLEIIDRIFLGLPENAGADQVENHVADIFARADPPVRQNRHDHRTEFLQRVLAHAFEKLRSRDVANRSALGFLLLF